MRAWRTAARKNGGTSCSVGTGRRNSAARSIASNRSHAPEWGVGFATHRFAEPAPHRRQRGRPGRWRRAGRGGRVGPDGAGAYGLDLRAGDTQADRARTRSACHSPVRCLHWDRGNCLQKGPLEKKLRSTKRVQEMLYKTEQFPQHSTPWPSTIRLSAEVLQAFSLSCLDGWRKPAVSSFRPEGAHQSVRVGGVLRRRHLIEVNLCASATSKAVHRPSVISRGSESHGWDMQKESMHQNWLYAGQGQSCIYVHTQGSLVVSSLW